MECIKKLYEEVIPQQLFNTFYKLMLFTVKTVVLFSLVQSE